MKIEKNSETNGVPIKNVSFIDLDSIRSDSKDENSVTSERAIWSSKLECVLSILGLSIGLGCVWRFPYMCYSNGGGAFLVPFFIVLIVAGIPLFFMEISLAQFSSKSTITIWSISPMFKGIGYSFIMVNTFLCIYYNVIITWVIYFLFASVTSYNLPWTNCNNSWNTERCASVGHTRNVSGMGELNSTLGLTFRTPSEEYYYNFVLKISNGIDNPGMIVWHLAICLGIAWLIVFCATVKGISSLGKVIHVSVLLPYVLLTIFFIRGMTLDGAVEGIVYYLKPNFSTLKNPRTWIEAATQVVFTLSLCTGAVTTIGSFNEFKNNCTRDSFLIPVISVCTNVYAGFSVFSVLGYLAKQKGVSVADVAQSGPGLMFVVYPEAISTMPCPRLWAILFFLMACLLGFSSQFSAVESIIASIIDEFPSLRKSQKRVVKFRIFVCVVLYLFGLSMVTQGGFYLFSLVDNIIGSFTNVIMGLFEILVIMHVYGYSNFADDIEIMLGAKPSVYFKVTSSYLTPAILMGILIYFMVGYERLTLFSHTYIFPGWAEVLGWSIFVICIAPIPIIFSKKLIKKENCKFIKEAFHPSSEWGPRFLENRSGRYLVQPPNDEFSINGSECKVKNSLNNDEENPRKKITFDGII